MEAAVPTEPTQRRETPVTLGTGVNVQLKPRQLIVHGRDELLLIRSGRAPKATV
jgi:hypothetical protein